MDQLWKKAGCRVFVSVLCVACLFSCADKSTPPEPPPTPVAVDAPPAQTRVPVLQAPPPRLVDAPRHRDNPVVSAPARQGTVAKREPVKNAPINNGPVANVVAKQEAPQMEPDKKTVMEPPVVKAAEPEKAVEPVPIMPAAGSVKGTVTILGKNSEKLTAREVIVSLEPISAAPAVKRQPKTYEISMVGKKYTPGVIAVKPGDTVKFHNKDAIKHNVFSSSGSNAFELGTYGLDVTEGTTLRHPGIVKVYCNIHADMAAFVSVSETNAYSFITKDNGQFSFNDLPVGEYRLTAWHVRGEASTTLQVNANQNASADMVINSASYVPETHLNKHGKPYATAPTLFKDEFY